MDRDQLKEFVTHGVVSLPSFLTAAQLQNYRDQAWRGLSAEENGGENLLDGRGGGKALDLTPSLDELPQMRALIEQIGGGRFTPEVPLPLASCACSPRPLLPGSDTAGWGALQHEREKTNAKCKVTLPASEDPVPDRARSGPGTPFENTWGHIVRSAGEIQSLSLRG